MPHSVHSTPRPSTPISNSIPYWNVNIPKKEWTQECPEYLVGLGEKNIEILKTRDEDFERLSWHRVRELIQSNRLELFERLPSDLHRYLHHIFDLKNRYGSVLTFIQHERLHWNSVTPSGDYAFTNPADYKILLNDWPYGIDDNITHLVVWTKFLLEEDVASQSGDLTDKARAEIEAFVHKTFCGQNGMPRDQLIWFKNWKSLKSVHALEHFHVMVYNAPKEYLDRLTHGDKAMCEKLKDGEH